MGQFYGTEGPVHVSTAETSSEGPFAEAFTVSQWSPFDRGDTLIGPEKLWEGLEVYLVLIKQDVMQNPTDTPGIGSKDTASCS